MSDEFKSPPGWLVEGAAIIILIAFCSTIVISSLSGDWHPVEIITPEVLVTLGFLFGIRLSKGQGK
jgi:hypothetical protein